MNGRGTSYAGGNGLNDVNLPRQRFTGKERDAETGLDYFGARYFSAAQGRFTSPDEWQGGIVDPFTGEQVEQPGPLPYADITDPQTLNKYAYVRNNPLRYVDPDGHADTGLLEVAEEVGEEVVEVVVKASRPAIQAVPKVAGAAAEGGASIVGFVGSFFTVALGTAGGADEVKFEREQQQRQQQHQQNPGQVKPATPSPQAEKEHTKGARPSTKEKHEKRRPGTSPPPNYKPFRKHERSDEEKKKAKEKPPYHRKDRDKKPDEG